MIVHKPNLPILPQIVSRQFVDVYLPNMTLAEKKSSSVSPYYENLEPFRGRLPSALFTCGTEDPLLEDSVMMATRWMIAGGEAYMKIYTGAPHAFIGFPPTTLKETGMAIDDTTLYIQGCMEKS
jgi:acetyl esterase/lipase